MPLSYEVEAIFDLDDRSGPAFDRIMEKVNALEERLSGIGTKFAEFGKEPLFAGLEQQLTALTAAAERAEVVLERLKAIGIGGGVSGSGRTLEDIVDSVLNERRAEAIKGTSSARGPDDGPMSEKQRRTWDLADAAALDRQITAQENFARAVEVIDAKDIETRRVAAEKFERALEVGDANAIEGERVKREKFERALEVENARFIEAQRVMHEKFIRAQEIADATALDRKISSDARAIEAERIRRENFQRAMEIEEAKAIDATRTRHIEEHKKFLRETGSGWLREEPGLAERASGFAEGVGARAMSIPAMIGGAATYLSGKNALEEDQALTESMMLLNVKQDDPEYAQDKAFLKKLAHDTAQGTKYTEKEQSDALRFVTEGIAGSTKDLSGPDRFKLIASIFPSIANAAEIASQFGLGNLDSNIRSSIQFVHALREYDPGMDEGQIGHGQELLLKIAERTGVRFDEMARTMAQGVPSAVGGKADAADLDATAEMIGYLYRGGLRGRAGYAVGQMILGSLITGGDEQHDEHHTKDITDFEKRIRERMEAGLKEEGTTRSDVFGHQIHTKEHDAALIKLGLEDPITHKSTMTEGGHFHTAEAFEKIADFVKNTKDVSVIAETLKNAFELRGARGADLVDWPTFIQMVKSEQNTPGIKEQQETMANTPLGKLQQIWARLQDIGNVMFTSILDPMERLENGLLSFLKGVDDLLTAHPLLAQMIAGAAVGAGTGGLLAGPVGAGIGAITGAGAALAHDVISGSSAKPKTPDEVFYNPDDRPGHLRDPLLTPGGILGGEYDKRWGIHNVPPALQGPLTPDFVPPAGPDKHSSLGTKIHIASLTINGAPTDSDGMWTRRILDKLASAADQARTHNTGLGWGSYGSPYDAGAMG